MDKLLFNDGIVFDSKEWQKQFGSVETEFNTLLKYLFFQIPQYGGILCGLKLKQNITDLSKIDIINTNNTFESLGAGVTRNGDLLFTTTGVASISLASYTLSAANYVTLKRKTENKNISPTTNLYTSSKRFSTVNHNVYNVIEVEGFDAVVYTQSEFNALSNVEKNQLVLLGKVTVISTNPYTFQFDYTDVKVIGTVIGHGVIYDANVVTSAGIQPSKFSTVSTEDDTYTGTPVNLEEFLWKIITQIKNITDSVSWDSVTTPIFSNLQPSLNNFRRSSIIENEDSEFSATVNGWDIAVSTGIALGYGSLVRSSGSFSIDQREILTVGDFSTKTNPEKRWFGNQPFTVNAYYGQITNTSNLHLLENTGTERTLGIDYNVNVTQGSIVSVFGGDIETELMSIYYKTYLSRWDLIYIDLTDKEIKLRKGTSSKQPLPPVINTPTEIGLFYIYIGEFDSTLTSSNIFPCLQFVDILPYIKFLNYDDTSTHPEIDKGVYSSETTSWITGGDTLLGRFDLGGAGTHTAGLSFGGFEVVASIISTFVESYNGTVWATDVSMSTAVYSNRGCGTQNAALSISGIDISAVSNLVQEFNGTTWITGGNVITARYGSGACGTQTAALLFNGVDISNNILDLSENYNGIVWSIETSTLVARSYNSGCGTSISALTVSGAITSIPTYTTSTEEFDGTNWVVGGSTSAGRDSLSSVGSQNSAICFGGFTDPSTVFSLAEQYNGLFWITISSLNSTRLLHSGCGSGSTAVCFCGTTDAATSIAAMATEEYTTVYQALTVTSTGAHRTSTGFTTGWATGGDLNVARGYMGEQTSSQTSALAIAGGISGASSNTDSVEEYNGTTWSTKSSVSVARRALAGCGNSSSALCFCGYDSGFSVVTEEYNGTSWVTGGDSQLGRYTLSGFGTAASALNVAGYDGTASTFTEEYNGSVWATSTSLPTGLYGTASVGITTAGLTIGGQDDSSPSSILYNSTYEFNGTTWSTSGNLSTARCGLAGCGLQSSALAFGGTDAIDPSVTYTDVAEKYNGTSWSTIESLNSVVTQLGGAGTSDIGLSWGGWQSGTSETSRTEEYGVAYPIPIYVWYFTSTGATTIEFDTSVIYYVFSKEDSKLYLVVNNPTGDYNSITITIDDSDQYVVDTEGYYGEEVPIFVADLTDGYHTVKVKKSEDDSVEISFLKVVYGKENSVADLATIYSDINKLDVDITSSLDIFETTLDSLYNPFSVSSLLQINTLYDEFLDKFLNIESYGFSSQLRDRIHKVLSFGEELDFKQLNENENLIVDGIDPNTDCFKYSIFDSKYLTKYGQDKYVFDSVWTAGGNLSTAREYLSGCGVQPSSLSFGGTTGTKSSITEEYDGSSWRSKNNLNVARKELAGCGFVSAALSFGGNISTDSPVSSTEEFDNTTWITGGDLNTARYGLGGCGTQNAALSFGGYNSGYKNTTEEYNGVVWGSSGNLSTTKWTIVGCGIQNAALSFGGYDGSYKDNTEEYNGSVWGTAENLNSAVSEAAGCGVQNAALSFGGYDSTYKNTTEKYNGVVWAVCENLIKARRGLSGSGNQNLGLSFGGYDGSNYLTNTEEYSFPEQIKYYSDNDSIFNKFVLSPLLTSSKKNIIEYNLTFDDSDEFLNKYSDFIMSSATQLTKNKFFISLQNAKLPIKSINSTTGVITLKRNDAIDYLSSSVFLVTSTGANDGYYKIQSENNTEITIDSFYSTFVQNQTSTGTIQSVNLFFKEGGVWITGGDLTTARSKLGGCGQQSSGLSFSGTSTGIVAIAEEYNGSVWEVKENLNYDKELLAGCGTQNAALSFGGYNSGYKDTTEEYDGLTWKTGGTLNTPRSALAGCGLQNAGLSFGGFDGDPKDTTEEYNGTVWTASGNLITARNYLAGCGTQNAGLSFGGNTDATEEYGGSTWVTGGNLITSTGALGGCGYQNLALCFGGSGPVDTVEEYDGTAWSAGASILEARAYLAGCGIQNRALAFGGEPVSGYSSRTEEYNYDYNFFKGFALQLIKD